MRPQSDTAAFPKDFVEAMVFAGPEIIDHQGFARSVHRQVGTGLWYVLATADQDETHATGLVAMGELLARDPTLARLAAMPPGRGARRRDAQAPWQAFTLAARPPAIEHHEEPVASEAAVLAQRVRRTAAGAGAIGTLIGLPLLVLGGILALTVDRRDPLFGVPANAALGAGAAVIGAWMLVCGLIAERRATPLPILLGALPCIAAVAYSALASAQHGLLVRGWSLAWPGTLPDAIAAALDARWHGICGDQAILAVIACSLLWRAGLLLVLRRRLLAEEATLPEAG
ncbi:MAG: hypothetical protein H0W72_15185 [Planctomycetes bacterium]|nr:hypothetical protein [Planctomycetota bacterium]